ncbi:DNA polymerase-4 [Propionibacterium cyclohexanicum]|uniref:DNA polymerase IV n=1 Tax=Propionibacterium cyclohexanicum TaxID=64702 RepID=A0A1H9QCP3_9ACTN|nr:DNA polymerase IV [Propionibacterium cyclohexanicum]SER58188.1 DNA polymerase-4 [Propionibacterium cyclohexanicum]
MRGTASVLHLDLDAFFASVEQRDKPSLRGKPVIVGGVGTRGVVATASYEARAFGVHSAMSTSRARRLAPHAAYLTPRFAAYRQSSGIVMALLGELSPLVEPLSIDEAFVDLAAGGHPLDAESLNALVSWLRAEITRRTEGLHASVGVGSSKLIAKLASEAAKPNGSRIVPPGEELDFLAPLPVRAIPGIGPATADKLNRLGLHTVAELRSAREHELVRELGHSVGEGLHALAFGRDDRPVGPRGEAKSISVEDTFATDLTEASQVSAVVARDAELVAERLADAGLFARTVTLKVRSADFTTISRSRTLSGATDSPERIAALAQSLVSGVDLRTGVRLVGLGVANLVQAAQEELFAPADESAARPVSVHETRSVMPGNRRGSELYPAGIDVEHDRWGRGWVWGSGHGVVTVRFESRGSGVGPVRSLSADDPGLHRAEIAAMAWARSADPAGSQHGPGWRRTSGVAPQD